MMEFLTPMRPIFAIPVLLSLAACVDRSVPVASITDAGGSRADATGSIGPVLGSDGYCQGTAPATADRIGPGISECELVRLKAKEPTKVAIQSGARGRREVQVLYADEGAREIYLFTDNRLESAEK
jgi:hypothetical protein